MEDKYGCIENWTCNDVATWLQEKGFGQYSELFTETHRIDGRALLCITEQDLRQPPLQLLVLGDIKNLALHIQELRSYTIQPLPNLARESYSNVVLEGRSREKRLFQSTNPLSYQRVPSRQDSTESEDIDSMLASNIHIQRRMKPTESNGSILDIPPELWKTILSFFYVFAVFMVTAFVMVVVHDRVPEMDKYPPLPDLFLDNMPHVPWAFEACELVGLVLAAMWFTLLFFHKYRFILMRRMFSLMGTIFLLRCVTMLITSLSVPGRHLQCSKRYGDWYTRFERTFQIWKGMGMSLQGVRSCGDYMFSGHTSVITLLNFFITEYTPRKYYYVHIVSWVLNFFGIFFLLAAHEHYSIDVFMAFYLSSRLFMYYHTLANNRALMAADAKRTRVWFPLFAFFESKCEGRVPNQFEFPLKHIIPSLKILFCNLKETASNKWSSTGNINDGLGSGETHEAKQD